MRRKETKTKVFIIPLQFLPVRYIIYCVKLIFDLRFLQREREKEMDLAKKNRRGYFVQVGQYQRFRDRPQISDYRR